MSSAVSAPACRIVICDDHPAFREVLTVALGLEDQFEVVGQAENGRDAIELVRELQPHVLLLDVAMPVMDGLTALPHLRDASPDTKILMLSGVTTADVRRRALDAGARIFLEKGTDVDVLAHQIRDACGL